MPLPAFDHRGQFGARFWGDDVGGDVVGLQVTRFIQGGLPFGGALVGEAVDEVEIDLRNPRLACGVDGGTNSCTVVAATEPSEIFGSKGLYAEAESGDASGLEQSRFGGSKAVGICFHRPLLRLPPRCNFDQFLKQGGGKSGGGASSEKNALGRNVELLFGPSPLGLEAA